MKKLKIAKKNKKKQMGNDVTEHRYLKCKQPNTSKNFKVRK